VAVDWLVEIFAVTGDRRKTDVRQLAPLPSRAAGTDRTPQCDNEERRPMLHANRSLQVWANETGKLSLRESRGPGSPHGIYFKGISRGRTIPSGPNTDAPEVAHLLLRLLIL
jgi:hypothetical protein